MSPRLAAQRDEGYARRAAGSPPSGLALEVGTTGDGYRHPGLWTDQFNDRDVLDGYAVMGREILAQAGHVDVFCAAVGTGGMLVGVADVLRAERRDGAPMTRMVAFEPASSPALTAGRGAGKTVVTVAVDNGLKYLAGDLFPG